LIVNETGAFLNVTESQNVIAREWRVSNTSGSGYAPFVPAETMATYAPVFTQEGTYYVVCASTNTYNDEVISNNEVRFNVELFISVAQNGVEEKHRVITFWNDSYLTVDISATNFNEPHLQLINLNGQTVLNQSLQKKSLNRILTQLSEGMYIFRIIDGNEFYTGKTMKQ